MQHPGRAPNYTSAFLVTLGVIVFMGLLTIAATKGIVAMMVSALLFDRIGAYVAARVEVGR